MTARLIVFEGGEGSGKTTQIRLLDQALGHRAWTTRQPGGTDLGTEIRRMLLGTAPGEVCDRAEALLYAADRAQHVDRFVRPLLDRGETVISDRWVDSSIAYQAAGRGMDREWIAQLSAWATGGLVPDLTILLDIDPTVGLARAAKRGAADRLEQEDLAFHQRVRSAYIALAETSPERYLVLDAAQPADWLADVIAERVRVLLGQEVTL
jgi:dTMP kinase